MNIMLYQDFLVESKDYYLYHWVSIKKMYEIINNDVLYANFVHIINGMKIKGNSFSRNKNLKINSYYIRMTVNQLKISYNYKILPLDGEIIHRKIDYKNDILKYNKFKDRNPKKTNVFGDSPISKNFDEYRFDEEFILGDIKNISKYIKKIEIYKPNWYSQEYDEELVNKVEGYCLINNITYINNNL